LGNVSEDDAEDMLANLCAKGFLRENMAQLTYGMPSQLRTYLQDKARASYPAMADKAVSAYVAYVLEVSAEIAELNSSRAEV
jgi:hypothetical protein